MAGNEIAEKPEEKNPVELAWEHYATQWEADTGRPTNYSQEIAAKVISDLVEGKTIRAMCAQSDRPGINTFYIWLNRHPAFREQVARARTMQAHQYADKALAAPDEALASLKGDKSDNARVQAYRLKADILRWRAGVQNQEYSEKKTVTHTIDTDTARQLIEARNRLKTYDRPVIEVKPTVSPTLPDILPSDVILSPTLGPITPCTVQGSPTSKHSDTDSKTG